MNKDRRKALDAIRAEIEEMKTRIEVLKEEEDDYYQNMPESFQQGDKGQAAEIAIENIESAIDSIDEAINALEEATI